jgi:hypothetical protein
MEFSKLVNSALRHLNKYSSPNHSDMDEESGLSHLAHAACCIAFLLTYEQTHPELDDREKYDSVQLGLFDMEGDNGPPASDNAESHAP